jgi:hypothetical protein
MKQMNYQMTYFKAPISNRVPELVITNEQLFDAITKSQFIRECTDRVQVECFNKERYKAAKVKWLPSVTPAGIFSHASVQGLVALNGQAVVDIDGLASPEEAERLRDLLFADTFLLPNLAFRSPSRLGVKLFIPCRIDPEKPLTVAFRESLERAWDYLDSVYEVKVDRANSDLCRSCLVCHDPHAKLRIVI